MAIEDGYQLALTLAERADQSKGQPMNIEAALRSYQSVRILCINSICFLAVPPPLLSLLQVYSVMPKVYVSLLLAMCERVFTHAWSMRGGAKV